MKLIAFVMPVSEVRQILAHVGLPTKMPKFQSARGPPQSDFWDSATASEWGVGATHPDGADQDQ
jgi:hypothetical protein